MKRLIYLLTIIIIFSSCLNSNTRNPKVSSISDSLFNDFVKCFKESSLPFQILKSQDFIPRMIYDSSIFGYHSNSFKTINFSHYGFIKQNYKNVSENFNNRYGFKVYDKDNLLILITIKDTINSDYESEENLLVINSYYNRRFVSSLDFAGTLGIFGVKYGSITQDLSIQINTLLFSKNGKSNQGIVAKELNDTYSISREGKIDLKETSTSEGIYEYQNGIYILKNKI